MHALLLASFRWTHQIDTWIVVVGALAAVSCALLGCFLVLRRMSLMGDAISHAVLPGLAIAFLLTESRGSLPMFVGAAIVGVLTAVFTEWVHRFGRVEQSAAMGVVFTALFAIGLILIVRAADRVDLDPGCVLYGAIELVPLNTHRVLGLEIPQAALTLGIALVLDLLFVLVFYKELKITSFDPALATTLGIDARWMHYALMALVAMTTVAAFEAVGSILVIAMLIVPAATAHLLTDRLGRMLILSALLAALFAMLGHVSAITVPHWFGFSDANTAGMIAVVAGALFGVALLIAPRTGLVSRAVHRLRLATQIAREDLLGVLYRFEEFGRPAATPGDVAAILAAAGTSSPFSRRAALRSLTNTDRIACDGDRLRLTPTGRAEAKQLVRAHRLWESYLSKHLGLPPDHLHPTAERLEHVTDAAMRDQLARDTASPAIDPQGKPIPPA